MLNTIAGLLLAATAYKCTLPDKSIVFQSIPCKVGAQEESKLPMTAAERRDAEKNREAQDRQREAASEAEATTRICSTHGYGDNHKACIEGLVKPQFSLWDGSHRGLESIVKNRMKNPSSYQHVQTQYIIKGGLMVITSRYRGTNSFGGTVLGTTVGVFRLDGKFISVVE